MIFSHTRSSTSAAAFSTNFFFPIILLLLSTLSQAQITGETCNSTTNSQQWTYDIVTGNLKSSSENNCLTLDGPPGDGTLLLMSPCVVDNSLQSFDMIASTNLIVSRADVTKCLNLAGYGTTSGTEVWLYGCVGTGYTCEGNCDWESISGGGKATILLQNSQSQLCLDDGYAPIMLRTCEVGSPSFNLPFCNSSLSRQVRIKDLIARLSYEAKLALYVLPLPVSLTALVNETLGLAAFGWDVTLIHGISSTYFVSPLPNATAFPHAIAQAASWDIDLAIRITEASAYEARAVSQANFRKSRGRSVQALNAEGGPLANTVHDARWGRAMETYGEDPELVSAFGVAVTRALQNTTNGFHQIASVARHWLGYHGATDLSNSGEEWVTPQWLADQHLPAYRALMVDAASEGVMCSCNTMRVGFGDNSSGGIPACVHPLYYHILRDLWNSTALVQADNEAIFPMFQDHHYYQTLIEAVMGAISSGVVAVDSGGGAAIVEALNASIVAGNISVALLDESISRQFEMRFKVGEFDTNNTAFPFSGPYDETQVDGSAHRALAREAASASMVLLYNNAILPLNFNAPPLKIAVIGPWANATSRIGGYFCVTPSYIANYGTTTSSVSTVIDAMIEAVGDRTQVTFSQGSDAYAPSSNSSINDAALLAGQSDFTLLVLGLGCMYETESNDRPDLYLPSVQDALLVAVSRAVRASGGGKLLLVTVSANVADIDQSLVDAHIQAFIPGEEAGHGLIDVIFGVISPSARLPLTVYANEYLRIAGPIADFNMVSEISGVGRTYRYADRIPPEMIRHKFGFGLSYTKFEYSNLIVTPSMISNQGIGTVNVSFSVANIGTGFSNAKEVVQVYVRVPTMGELITPLLALRGFSCVTLDATKPPSHVEFILNYPHAFSTTLFNGSSVVTGGQYEIYVSGHQPNDIEGAAQSNILSLSIQVPSSIPTVPFAGQ